MKNPLYKRVPRELKSDFGKYIALFLFLCLTITLVSGFLVADGSTLSAYNESFSKYNIEDGHFTLVQKADSKWLNDLEDKEDIKVYPMTYKDKPINKKHTIRIYKNRKDINKVDVMSGKLPKEDNEIAIDRLYAENNNLEIGDNLKIQNKNYKIVGLVALSDYTALFKNNTDMMFDANKFTVSVVTDKGFNKLNDNGIKYCYSWDYNHKHMTEDEINDKADDIQDEVAKTGMVTDFVKEADNTAIHFAGDDMGGDRVMFIWLLYIIMIVLAFVFAVTTRNTIEKESSVIGTLRASGYSKGELLRHYIVLPVVVTILSAIVGNICGYTFMKGYMAGMYYHSYSLPTYVTKWNGYAFVITTIVPALIIFVVNVIVLAYTLSLSPLKFLRHDLKRKKKKKAVKLPNWKFITRFRVRIILQNRSAYIMMFIGIILANVLLVFGLMMAPLLTHFKSEVMDSKIANYQYILKVPVETNTKNAEKYCVRTLENDNGEEITVYGIEEDSKYLKDKDLPTGDKEVLMASSVIEKYSLDTDTNYTLTDKYTHDKYKFKIKDSYKYPATMAVFMTRDEFNKVFDKDKDYYTGYFSNTKIKDIDESYIASTITEQDLTVMADQLDDSMGQMFIIIGGFSIMLFILVIYLLAKIVVEKNAKSISMVKILGYNDHEASKLYNTSTAIVVAISLLLSMPICNYIIKGLYFAMMQDFNGWLTYYIAPYVLPLTVVIGGLSYIVVHFIQSKKIKKIPMSQALKDME